jgi:ABC-type amino acid transport substrate-binding protein
MRYLLSAFLAFTAAFTLSLSAAVHAGETLDRVVEKRTLVVGMSADQPPMNAVNRQGNYMGFDVDLATALASAMRVQLKIEKVPFGELMDALQAGRVDMVVSGMAITPERSRRASFVGPYMIGGKSILSTEQAIAQFASGELASKEVKLAALSNSTSADFVREAAPNATLVEVKDYAEAIDMLLAGEAEGLVADEVTCKLAVLRNPDAGLVTIEKPLTVEPFGIAVDARDREFLNLVGNYVRAYEGTGLLDGLRRKWFESNSWIAALP